MNANGEQRAGSRAREDGAAKSESLGRLVAMLRDQGGLIATMVRGEPAPGRAPANGSSPAQLAAAGPRAAGAPSEYELLVEAIYEGYLLHYGEPRVLSTGEADLALLAGDQLYALGLAKLVGLGDLEAVAELADVITLCALAHGAGDDELAAVVWAAGARAVGWGPSEAHARAKALARAGSHEALEALRHAAAG